MDIVYEYRSSAVFALIVCLSAASGSIETTHAETWRVPVVGNSFRLAPSTGRLASRRSDAIRVRPSDVYASYVHFDRAARLTVAVEAKGRSESGGLLKVSSTSGLDQSVEVDATDWNQIELGEIQTAAPGYVQFDFSVEAQSSAGVEIRALIITSAAEEVTASYVRSNDGNMFYWGRRGPSVHLTYVVPPGRNWMYGYSELTVPVGSDPIGSYFMANGFAEGYFGMQVNSATERRILFSVWSPFRTDDPRKIPETHRIKNVGRGPDVHVGKFGNEGSGGQSYWVYPWVAGETYCFLTEVQPLEEEYTRYTSWFRPKDEAAWNLIASFERPKTSTYLKRFHSFLENFSPSHGHLRRRVEHGGIWVGDPNGNWHPSSSARFSVDATGGKRHRVDFKGGAFRDRFFLENCGFFHADVKPGTTFERSVQDDAAPEIDLSKLPR